MGVESEKAVLVHFGQNQRVLLHVFEALSTPRHRDQEMDDWSCRKCVGPTNEFHWSSMNAVGSGVEIVLVRWMNLNKIQRIVLNLKYPALLRRRFNVLFIISGKLGF